MKNLVIKVLCLILLAVVWILPTSSYADTQDDWTKNTMIAHALGGIDGNIHVNSIDAFEESYQKGFKVFETDLTLTSDNQLVANHDWSGYTTPPTYAQFMNNKVLGKYTPTDFNEIVNFLAEHPDIYLVTDTKETDPELIRKQFNQIVDTVKQVDPSLLDHIVPEIYTPEMYNIVQAIYPFKNKYYSIYLLGDTPKDRDQIIAFMREHNIKTLTMPVERLDQDYINRIKLNDFTLYVFTVNSQDQVSKLEKMGVHGFYTDFLAPQDTPQTIKKPTLLAKLVSSVKEKLHLSV